MASDFSSGRRSLRSSPLWWGGVLLSLPFLAIFIGRVVAAFHESPTQGWHVLGIAGTVAGGGAAVIAMVALGLGAQRYISWRSVQQSHPENLVLIARRTTDTSDAATEIAGKPTLHGGADEFFIVAVSDESISAMRLADPQRAVLNIQASSVQRVSIERRTMFSGHGRALSMTIEGSVNPFDFVPLDHRALGIKRISGSNLIATCRTLRDRLGVAS